MPLHVSSTVVLIIGRSKLSYTASGIVTSVGGRPVHRTATISLAERCPIPKALLHPDFKVFGIREHPSPPPSTDTRQKKEKFRLENLTLKRSALPSIENTDNYSPGTVAHPRLTGGAAAARRVGHCWPGSVRMFMEQWGARC